MITQSWAVRVYLMWEFMFSLIASFRHCFSRAASFHWFSTILIGIMVRSDRLGLTSVIRDLNLKGECYEKMMHFFRSDSWNLKTLHDHWHDIVRKMSIAFLHKDRLVFVIDGTKQSKEGHYMPGVKKMANDSDTQSKPQTMHGHMAGMLSLLIGSEEKISALPLKMTIQDGVKEMSGWEGSNVPQESHLVQMFRMTSEAVNHFKQSSIVLADRLFLTMTALAEIKKHNDLSEYRLDMVTKCKSNVVAYTKPVARKGRGRPRKKGRAFHLNRFFNQKDRFKKTTMKMYGIEKEVYYHACNLLWGHGTFYELRFVLVAYDNVTSILASTDLTMSAEEIISLYEKRFRIEHLFRSLKQYYGGFSYHFWTKAMPRLNRYKKKTDPDPLSQVTDPKERKRIIETLRATEMYLFIANIAIGITMIISIRYDIDPTEFRYQRTPVKKKPSEDNIQCYLRKWLFCNLTTEAGKSINSAIISNQHCPNQCAQL